MPPEDLGANAVAVPCLGGLTTPDLLNFVIRTEGTVAISDHGWCKDCPVGRCAAPWQSTVDETKGVLSAVDERLAKALVVTRENLPINQALPVLRALRPEKQVGRRDFLRRLISPAEQARDPLAESRRVVAGRGLVNSIKRERILEEIRALVAELERPLPSSLLPAVKISDGCDLDGICSSVCPTGALVREETRDAVALRFESTKCIACGLCQGACRNKALSLWPHGDCRIGVESATLVTRRTANCAHCGERFVPSDNEQFCSFCERATALMREASTLRFTSPPPSSDFFSDDPPSRADARR